MLEANRLSNFVSLFQHVSVDPVLIRGCMKRKLTQRWLLRLYCSFDMLTNAGDEGDESNEGDEEIHESDEGG